MSIAWTKAIIKVISPLHSIFNSVSISLWLWIYANLQKWIKIQHMHWCPCCVYRIYNMDGRFICLRKERMRNFFTVREYDECYRNIRIPYLFHESAFFGVTQTQNLWSKLESPSSFFYFHLVGRPCLLFICNAFYVIISICTAAFLSSTFYQPELILQSCPNTFPDFCSLFALSKLPSTLS